MERLRPKELNGEDECEGLSATKGIAAATLGAGGTGVLGTDVEAGSLGYCFGGFVNVILRMNFLKLDGWGCSALLKLVYSGSSRLSRLLLRGAGGSTGAAIDLYIDGMAGTGGRSDWTGGALLSLSALCHRDTLRSRQRTRTTPRLVGLRTLFQILQRSRYRQALAFALLGLQLFEGG